MATVQVIMAGNGRVTVHDTYDYPLVLQFGSKRTYEDAEWVIPSYARHIPTWRLSEIRIEDGPLTVLVDGPEGFSYGPFLASSVRNLYPRGKLCAFLRPDSATGKLVGLMMSIVEDTLIVEEYTARPSSP